MKEPLIGIEDVLNGKYRYVEGQPVRRSYVDMEKIGIENMKKSEISTMANTFVEKFRNVSAIEKSYLWEGYIMGAMEILYKLGIEVTVDAEE